MFNITENNNEIGSCDCCGAVGGVFGELSNSSGHSVDIEMCPECYLIVIKDE
jgi:hypothetical protein